MTGKIGIFSAKGGLDASKFGDDVGFPDVSPWSYGIWIKDLELTSPEGVELGKKDK